MKYLQYNIDDSLEFQLLTQLYDPLYRVLRCRLDWNMFGHRMVIDMLRDPLYIQVYKQVYWNLYSKTRTYEIYTK